MPKSRSRSNDNKPKNSIRQNNLKGKEEKLKNIKKKEIKTYNKISLKKEEKSPRKRTTTNSKGKEKKLNEEKIENSQITRRVLRSEGKLISPEDIDITKKKKKARINDKKAEEKEMKLEDNDISEDKIDKKPKSQSKSKTKYKLRMNRKSKKEYDYKKLLLDEGEDLEKKIDEIIKNQKEEIKIEEEENEENIEKVPKTKIKSIEKLKNTIKSKTVKSNINVSKKLEYNDNNQKKKERNNSGDKKEKKNNLNLINNKPNKVKRKSPKKAKDISSACDAEESLSFSEQNIVCQRDESNLYNSIDSQKISREVEEIIKRIEKKKEGKRLNYLANKKRKRDEEKKEQEEKISKAENRTAEEFNFILQKNPNIKNVSEYINIEEISRKSIISYTDILLVILEICQNSNSYLFAYSTKSKMFWNDVLQYKILKKIFNEFKAETLRKYWNVLSKYDADNIYDLINKNKEYIDATPSMKLGKIVSTISKIFSGKIPDFKEFINGTEEAAPTRSLKKTKIFHKATNRPRKKIEKNSKNLSENNIKIFGLKEEYNNIKGIDYQNSMDKIFDKENNKKDYLKIDNKDKNINLNKMNQEDKFIFKSIDMIVDGISKEFNNYSKEYILDILQQNSMNIRKTYICLKEPMKSKIIGFTPLDDKIILKMAKGEEFNNLLREKGKKSILEREEYLSN